MSANPRLHGKCGLFPSRRPGPRFRRSAEEGGRGTCARGSRKLSQGPGGGTVPVRGGFPDGGVFAEGPERSYRWQSMTQPACPPWRKATPARTDIRIHGRTGPGGGAPAPGRVLQRGRAGEGRECVLSWRCRSGRTIRARARAFSPGGRSGAQPRLPGGTPRVESSSSCGRREPPDGRTQNPQVERRRAPILRVKTQSPAPQPMEKSAASHTSVCSGRIAPYRSARPASAHQA